MKSNAKVKVINNTTGSIGFRDMNDKKYLFNTKNSFKNIDFEIIEGLYNEYPNYITKGYLLLSPITAYAELGIGEDEYKKFLSMKDIEKLLEEDADTIEQIVEELPAPIKENVAIIAKEKKIDSSKKRKAIKKTTGFDIGDPNEEE